MELNLTNLSNGKVIKYDDDFVIDKEVYESMGILDLKDLHVVGSVYLNSALMLIVNLTVTGVMIIPDSVTNEPVKYPFTSKIDEEFDVNDQNFLETYQKTQNILDIMKILWENIVLEVPMRFTMTNDAHLSGDGWRLGEEENINDNIDPRMAKLAELLDNGKE